MGWVKINSGVWAFVLTWACGLLLLWIYQLGFIVRLWTKLNFSFGNIKEARTKSELSEN